MHVTQIEIRGIDQRAVTIFSSDFKSPERRFSKRILDRSPLVTVVAVRAEFLVRRYQQNLRTRALESHDVALSQLPSIQTDIVGTDSSRQRFNVKKLSIPLVDLQPN